MENSYKILGIKNTLYSSIWLLLFITVCVLYLVGVLNLTLSVIFFGALMLAAILNVVLSSRAQNYRANRSAWGATLCSFLGLMLSIFC